MSAATAAATSPVPAATEPGYEYEDDRDAIPLEEFIPLLEASTLTKKMVAPLMAKPGAGGSGPPAEEPVLFINYPAPYNNRDKPLTFCLGSANPAADEPNPHLGSTVDKNPMQDTGSVSAFVIVTNPKIVAGMLRVNEIIRAKVEEFNAKEAVIKDPRNKGQPLLNLASEPLLWKDVFQEPVSGEAKKTNHTASFKFNVTPSKGKLGLFMESVAVPGKGLVRRKIPLVLDDPTNPYTVGQPKWVSTWERMTPVFITGRLGPIRCWPSRQWASLLKGISITRKARVVPKHTADSCVGGVHIQEMSDAEFEALLEASGSGGGGSGAAQEAAAPVAAPAAAFVETAPAVMAVTAVAETAPGASDEVVDKTGSVEPAAAPVLAHVDVPSLDEVMLATQEDVLAAAAAKSKSLSSSSAPLSKRSRVA